MTINSSQLRELQNAISDRIYLQIENWNLYLGDAGLAEALSIECNAFISEGPEKASKKALESVQVQIGGNKSNLPLSRFVSSQQCFELEELLRTYCG